MRFCIIYILLVPLCILLPNFSSLCFYYTVGEAGCEISPLLVPVHVWAPPCWLLLIRFSAKVGFVSQTHRWNERAVMLGGRGLLPLWPVIWAGRSLSASLHLPLPWEQARLVFETTAACPVWMFAHTINHIGYPPTFLWPLQKIYNVVIKQSHLKIILILHYTSYFTIILINCM